MLDVGHIAVVPLLRTVADLRAIPVRRDTRRQLVDVRTAAFLRETREKRGGSQWRMEVKIGVRARAHQESGALPERRAKGRRRGPGHACFPARAWMNAS